MPTIKSLGPAGLREFAISLFGVRVITPKTGDVESQAVVKTVLWHEDQWISTDASFWICAFKVGNLSRHWEQYVSLDCALRRKLHPQNSQYLASRTIAPTGTLWVSYSCRPCQRASGSFLPGAAEV